MLNGSTVREIKYQPPENTTATKQFLLSTRTFYDPVPRCVAFIAGRTTVDRRATVIEPPYLVVIRRI